MYPPQNIVFPFPSALLAPDRTSTALLGCHSFFVVVPEDGWEVIILSTSTYPLLFLPAPSDTDFCVHACIPSPAPSLGLVRSRSPSCSSTSSTPCPVFPAFHLQWRKRICCELPSGLQMQRAFVFINFITVPRSAIPTFLSLPALVAPLQEAEIFQSF